jgi:hypothetical protein
MARGGIYYTIKHCAIVVPLLRHYIFLAQCARWRADSTRSALASDLDNFRLRGKTSWSYSDLALHGSVESLLRKKSKDPLVDITPTLTGKSLHICLSLRKVSDDNYLVYLYCRVNKRGN